MTPAADPSTARDDAAGEVVMQQRPGRGVPPAGKRSYAQQPAGVPRAAVVPLVGVDPATVSDAHLAAAWAACDRLALGEVFRRYGSPLFGAAAALLDDRAVAADAVHDALVRAAARVGTLEAPARLYVWLLAVVRAEAAQRSLHPPGAGWSPTPALPAARWRAGGPPVADAETLWSAAAALDERDREVLELLARGVADTRDLADVLGVTAQQAAVLTADMQVRLEVALGALLVARAGGEGCPELAAALAAQGPAWTRDVLVLVVRHQQDCMDCRAVRSRLVPPVPPSLDGPRHVPLDPGLRARVVASLGALAPPAADPAVRSWLVDEIPAGLSGRGWSWYPDGFPVQPQGPVRRVADVVADAEALTAAEAAAFAAVAERAQPRPARRVPPLAAAVLLGVPLLVTGLVLSGVVPTGAGMPGMPGAPGGSGGLGVVVAEGTRARTPGATGAAGTSGATGSGGPGGAGTPAAGAVDTSGTSRGGVVDGTAGGAGATPGASTPATQPGVVDPVGSPSSDPQGTPVGPSSTTTTAAGSPTREPVSAPVADGASVSPGTVRTPSGSDCKPLRTTVTVPVGDSDGMSGSVTWSNGRATQRTPLVAGSGALTATVGPFQTAGTSTLTITLTSAGGSDTVTRTVEVVACGQRAE